MGLSYVLAALTNAVPPHNMIIAPLMSDSWRMLSPISSSSCCADDEDQPQCCTAPVLERLHTTLYLSGHTKQSIGIPMPAQKLLMGWLHVRFSTVCFASASFSRNYLSPACLASCLVSCCGFRQETKTGAEVPRQGHTTGMLGRFDLLAQH